MRGLDEGSNRQIQGTLQVTHISINPVPGRSQTVAAPVLLQCGWRLQCLAVNGFGVQHTEEAAAEGEADGVADAEGAVVLHTEVDGSFDGGGDVDIVVV